MYFQLFILLVLTPLVFILWIQEKHWKGRKKPPGPIKFPILGSLPLLGKNPSKTFYKWSKTYGPIISVQLGSYPALILNDAKIIKESFNMSAFAGRPHLRLFDDYSKRKGLLFGDSPKNQEQRQFTLVNIRDFGYRNKSIESVILEEISEQLQFFRSNPTKKVAVQKLFNVHVFNVLWEILFSERFDHEDQQLSHLVHLVSEIKALRTTVEVVSTFMPWLSKLAPNFSGYNRKMGFVKEILDFMREKLSSHQATRVKRQPRDFNDSYFDKIEETNDVNSSFHFTDEDQHVVTNGELFATGVDAVSTGLEWLFYYMADNLEVQEELRKEIHIVIGTCRRPSLLDRPSMPYTEAVIYETLRKSSFAPMGLFHRTKEDVYFHDYFIPKNTLVISDIYTVHHGKSWGDPENFRPARFLGKDGKLLKMEEFIPFSVGQRHCIGEKLARDSLFLYTVSIFQKFTIQFSEGQRPKDECKFGIVVSPPPFHVVLKEIY